MSGNWDSTIKLTYGVDDNQFFAIDTVENGKAFDVVANVEVGKNLMGFADREELWVTVRNLTKSRTLLSQKVTNTLTSVEAPRNEQLRVNFGAGWQADEGDALDVIATYKLTAGVYTNYSLAFGDPFMVSR
jgi:hypothetical protein